jgi:hypothetical protein
MDASSINNFGAASTRAAPVSRGLDDFKAEDFFALLINELQSQDPLKPNDSRQLVQEMSTIRQMDQSVKLNETLTAFANSQKSGGAANLIGRYVTGHVTSGNADSTAPAKLVGGIVTGVQYSANGEALLELHTGGYLAVDKIETVALVDPALLAQVLADLAENQGTPGTGNGTGNGGELPSGGGAGGTGGTGGAGGTGGTGGDDGFNPDGGAASAQYAPALPNQGGYQAVA